MATRTLSRSTARDATPAEREQDTRRHLADFEAWTARLRMTFRRDSFTETLPDDQVAGARARATAERDTIASARACATAERDAIAATRALAATERHTMAGARDDAATERDTIAGARDDAAAERDTIAGTRDATGRENEAKDRADDNRERARLRSALHRARLDDLTGSYRRKLGRIALINEIDRARRGDGRFVVAFVDVNGLKLVNDRDGHAAGDHVLRTLAATMRSNLRSFDPIVRYGGDEFVCGLGGIDPEGVERRFSAIDRFLQDALGVGITVGLASLAPDDSVDQLIARADAALLDTREKDAANSSRAR